MIGADHSLRIVVNLMKGEAAIGRPRSHSGQDKRLSRQFHTLEDRVQLPGPPPKKGAR